MRSLSIRDLFWPILSTALLAFRVSAETISNPDFETGSAQGWSVASPSLAVDVSTNDTFNRNYAARMHGAFESSAWITSSLSQTVAVKAGDRISAVGFFNWKQHAVSTSAAEGYVEASLRGGFPAVTQRWTEPTNDWLFFDLGVEMFGLCDGGFESGSLGNWNIGADDLCVALDHDTTFEGNCSLRMSGAWSDGWSFNQAYQLLHLRVGDVVEASARVNVKTFEKEEGWAVAGIKLEQEGTSIAFESALAASTSTTGWASLGFTARITNEGYYVFRCMACGNSSNGTTACDVYFDDVRLSEKRVRVLDGGFEEGTNTFSYWTVGRDRLEVTVATNLSASGGASLRMAGGWSGWGWNQAYQLISARSGDVINARGKLYIADLERSRGWVVAGIKLEGVDGNGDYENVYDHASPEGSWLDMAFTAAITNPGDYVFRCMVCGECGVGSITSDVYFDEIELWRSDEPTGEVSDVTLAFQYCGSSGGTGVQSSVDLYLDSVTFSGSSANPVPATNLYGALRAAAAAVAADASESDIAEVVYPPLNSYGHPGGETNDIRYPSYAEMAVAGWRFRYLTNDVVLTVTNTLKSYAQDPDDPLSWIEFDQYASCAKFWHTPRGVTGPVETNAPYFALGVQDGSSAEFGEGPFPPIYTYVVGSPLTNFPRRMATTYDGVWPVELRIVYPENFLGFDRNWDKYFILSTVRTNTRGKLLLGLSCNDAGNTNLLFQSDQFVHLGSAARQEAFGMVDYPNCTYQDHNEVALRAAWANGLIDQDGWFMQQVPRGSATIEPMALYSLNNGNWNYKVYEEALFAWPSAASDVRSIFDGDTQGRVPGPASYNVGFKIGHQFGTNEFGEPRFPGIVELRGNGYFRMTDYGGVMGGSFRPVSADIFGIYQYREDAPLIPEAYLRLVSRSTPTGEADNSYAEITMPIRSKTNQWFTGAVRVDAHFAPGEVENTGAYFDLEGDLYANRPLVRSEHGKLNAFAQVDMYWRGGDAVDDHTEGHDFDAIMVQKADGEWITHHPINPPTNIYHRTLSSLRSNDVVYLMQQDRGALSYGYSTEAPYRKVSSFEITVLNDGGRDLELEMYEQNTVSEINDNVVVAGSLDEDLAKGDRVHYKYRYRSAYAPGVSILSPNEPAGGEGWSNQAYTIEFVATDGEDVPLQANLFYGSGRDDDWHLINVGELLLVPEATHRLAYAWDASSVPPGAYYVRAEVERLGGGKIGFDVSDTRLQVGPYVGFPNNGTTNQAVVTNAFGYLGTNMSFETGNVLGWNCGSDDLDIYASGARAWDGVYSGRLRGNGWADWSWNNLQQEIPCRSGEVLHVTGRMYIGRLVRSGTNWLACGIKMEPTNGVGPQAGVEFRDSFTTGVWLNIDFERVAPVDGADRLLLWVAGYDCGGADVFFDDIKVTSTNLGTVVTNRVRNGYWEGDWPADVSGHDALSFCASSAGRVSNLLVWAADTNGVTNAVSAGAVADRLVSVPQPFEVSWTNFPGVDRTHVLQIGFKAEPPNALRVASLKSVTSPLRVTAQFVDPPAADLEGLPHYNAGEEVVQVVTVENRAGTDLSGLRLQLLQEYGESATWYDQAKWQNSLPKWSEKTRRGDRLCGEFERVWTNLFIPAGGSLALTNVYAMPVGRLIDHTRFAIPSEADWHIFRNYAARAQAHVAVRRADGTTIFDQDQAGLYSMDDDFDIDNDRLPDAWEMAYGGSRTGMFGDDDPDGDGYENLAECLAGSDPTDPYSFPGHATSYTLHLAYTNGVDEFPHAVAEQSNYTGAACNWMIARYLNGDGFGASQGEIYGAIAHSPEHFSEVTPEGSAGWLQTNAPAGYHFAARCRTNLNDALKETVYWMDYLPPGGKKTPVHILSGTGWSYKVVRGFETDRAPYDGGSGVGTGCTYTIYGCWLNDPKVSGVGHDLYSAAAEMSAVYAPSEADGRYWLVSEPPADESEREEAIEQMDRCSLQMAADAGQPAMAAYFNTLFGDGSPVPSGGELQGPPPGASLFAVLPPALKQDEGFMSLFDMAAITNYYRVDDLGSGSEYVLGAGEVRGPASTVFVLKMNRASGAFQQATWSASSFLYLPISLHAAVWAVCRGLGTGSADENNLLTNAGFETNSGSGGIAEHWTSGGAVTTEPWGYRSGGWSMAVCGWKSLDYAYFYQDVGGCRPGTGYTFSVWAEKDNDFAASVVELKLEWFSGTMSPLGAASSNVWAQLTNSHALFRVSGVAPAGAEVVRCTVWVGGMTYCERALKFDDACLATAENGARLVDARLVYDPAVDASPFLPRWRLVYDVGGQLSTGEVAQGNSLWGDEDGDGMENRLELYAGMNPLDAGSFVGLDEVTFSVVGPGEISIRWPSSAGRTYAVWRAADLEQAYVPVAVHLSATPPVNEYREHLSAERGYYRVEVE